MPPREAVCSARSGGQRETAALGFADKPRLPKPTQCGKKEKGHAFQMSRIIGGMRPVYNGYKFAINSLSSFPYPPPFPHRSLSRGEAVTYNTVPIFQPLYILLEEMGVGLSNCQDRLRNDYQKM